MSLEIIVQDEGIARHLRRFVGRRRSPGITLLTTRPPARHAGRGRAHERRELARRLRAAGISGRCSRRTSSAPPHFVGAAPLDEILATATRRTPIASRKTFWPASRIGSRQRGVGAYRARRRRDTWRSRTPGMRHRRCCGTRPLLRAITCSGIISVSEELSARLAPPFPARADRHGRERRRRRGGARAHRARAVPRGASAQPARRHRRAHGAGETCRSLPGHGRLLRNEQRSALAFPRVRRRAAARQSLRARAQPSALRRTTTFHGHRDDIAACHRGLDVLVICSDHEGLPMTLLEAAGGGYPGGRACGRRHDPRHRGMRGGPPSPDHYAAGYAAPSRPWRNAAAWRQTSARALRAPSTMRAKPPPSTARQWRALATMRIWRPESWYSMVTSAARWQWCARWARRPAVLVGEAHPRPLAGASKYCGGGAHYPSPQREPEAFAELWRRCHTKRLVSPW